MTKKKFFLLAMLLLAIALTGCAGGKSGSDVVGVVYRTPT